MHNLSPNCVYIERRCIIIRLPNGYGSVVKLSGNRRRPYMVRKTVSKPDEIQKQVPVAYFAKRSDALAFLADLNKNPFLLDATKITFAKAFEMWHEETYTAKGKTMPHIYNAAYNQWCAPIHNELLKDLKLSAYQKLVDDCPRSYNTKKNIKILCNKINKWACANDMLAKNYVEYVELPEQVDSEIHQPFTADELTLLWDNTSIAGVKIVLILIYTGLRPTELILIQSADVHLDERYMIGGIKTEAGKNRRIPIAKKIEPFIAELLADGAQTLVSQNKAAITYDMLRRDYWQPAMKELGLQHLPHDGRHTCQTLLDNANVKPKICKLILGHSSRDITEKVYTHKTIEQLVEAIDSI